MINCDKIQDNSLFSVYIQKDSSLAEMPLAIRSHIETFKRHCISHSQNHYLIGDAEIKEVLRAHFSEDILIAYETIQPHAYKADIGRYAVLYAYGGIYADLSVQFLNSPHAESQAPKGWLCHGIRRFNIWNGFMKCQKNEPLLLRTLQQISAHASKRFYGANPVSITGPRLLHEVLQEDPRLGEGFYFHKVKELTPDLPHTNMAVLKEDGEIICVRNKRKVGGLDELGLVSSDYRAMWAERMVYREETID